MTEATTSPHQHRVGRSLTDTFAGIAPADVPGFTTAQLLGLIIGTGLLLALYPATWRASTMSRPPGRPGDGQSRSPDRSRSTRLIETRVAKGKQPST